MKASYYLIKHDRGNHSAKQVYNHGKIHYKGNKLQCNAELVRMRKSCKEKYHSTSTNSKIREFIDYEMADIFFIRVKNGKPEKA